MTAHLLFGATHASSTTLDLWAADATSAAGAIDLGVAIAQDFDPVRIGGVALFIGGTDAGAQIWSTDGSVSGTSLFSLYDASGRALTVNAMQAFAGGAVVAASNPSTHANSLWFTDGTRAGTRLLAQGLQAEGLAGHGFVVFGQTLLFAAAPDPFQASNQLLYRTDGTAAGTRQLSPSGTVLAPQGFAALGNGRVVIASGRSASGAQAISLWVTDASSQGTRQLAGATMAAGDVMSGLVSLGPVAVLGFSTWYEGGSALWASDGTAAGTRQIVVAGGSSNVLASVSGVAALGGIALFAGVDSLGRAGLWSTSGTDASTVLVASYRSIDDLVVYGGRVAFRATDASGRSGLWLSDGTPAGTSEIRPSGAASTGLNPQGLFVYFDRLGFTGADSAGRSAIWLSDGSTAGTLEAARPLTATVVSTSTGIAGTGNLVTLSGTTATYAAGDGDTVRAGAGSNIVTAGSGQVQVAGGVGHLQFNGGVAPATVIGGYGPATVMGGSGGGLFTGGSSGSNVLVAAGGNTTLIGGGTHDALFGAGWGTSSLVAAHAGETLVGGGGATRFAGGSQGAAVIFAGGGDATVAAGSSGGDTVVGGAGTLQVQAAHGEAVFTGSGATTVGGSAAGAADSIVGGSGSLVVGAAGGNMIVVGGSGPSAIATGTGYGLIFQGSGSMQIASGGGPLQVVEGRGPARIAVGAGGLVLDIVKGAGGGFDVVAGFDPTRDRVELFGYGKADVHTHVSAGSITISLSDGSQVTLLGVSDPKAGLAMA